MTESEATTEKCDRCGEEGEDRRTLWHSCFYEMKELGLPFELHPLFHADLETLAVIQPPVMVTPKGGRPIVLMPGTVKSENELTPQTFYTLRVCRRCRADWLDAIKRWFTAGPKARPSCGSGIFVREHGVNVEITREEWDRRVREERTVKP